MSRDCNVAKLTESKEFIVNKQVICVEKFTIIYIKLVVTLYFTLMIEKS